MSDEPFLKCDCQQCGESIEFPSQGVGLTIDCPHCNRRTILTGSPAPEAVAPPGASEPEAHSPPAAPAGPAAGPETTGSRSLRAVAALLALGALAGGIVWYFKAGPGSRRKDSPSAALSSTNTPKPVPAAAPESPASNDAPAAVSVAGIEKSIDDLKPGAVTLEKAKSGNLVYAVGTLKNDSDLQRFGVKVEIEFTDAKGRPAGKATDYTQVIEPRQEWRFRALVLDARAASGRVVGVKEDN